MAHQWISCDGLCVVSVFRCVTYVSASDPASSSLLQEVVMAAANQQRAPQARAAAPVSPSVCMCVRVSSGSAGRLNVHAGCDVTSCGAAAGGRWLTAGGRFPPNICSVVCSGLCSRSYRAELKANRCWLRRVRTHQPDWKHS